MKILVASGVDFIDKAVIQYLYISSKLMLNNGYGQYLMETAKEAL